MEVRAIRLSIWRRSESGRRDRSVRNGWNPRGRRTRVQASLAATAVLGFVALATTAMPQPAKAATFRELAYVANAGPPPDLPGSVSVIDTATNTVQTTITVGNAPFDVAAAPDGKRVYVPNSGSSTVSVIDTATNRVTNTIAVPNGAFGVAVNQHGSRAYVTSGAILDSPHTGFVSVVDTTTNTVVDTIATGLPTRRLVITPDGAHAYAGLLEVLPLQPPRGFLAVIDLATGTVVKRIPVGVEPSGIAITPDGALIYVNGRSSVAGTDVVSTTTNTVVATAPAGAAGLAVTPDGSRVYTAGGIGFPDVSVISTATNTITARINIGTGTRGVGVTPDGAKAYVTRQAPNLGTGGGTATVISIATNTVTTTITVGDNPGNVAFARIKGDARTSPPAWRPSRWPPHTQRR
jgi:YVTN family beta-propeller protein